MKLVIAKKPSVAQSIAAALGVIGKKDGYIEGGGYLISWCVGHLVQLAEAAAYGEQYKKWSYDSLPILPQKWQYTVSADKGKHRDPGSAATATKETAFCLTTGTSAYARSLFPIRCSASGFGLPYFPLIKNCMRSFSKPRICGGVPCAVLPLLQAQTASNTARTAGSVSPGNKPPSA